MPKVSVIVPVHNAEPYIRQCMDSILSQTLADIEIICVENGSSDNSLQILREYESHDVRLRVIVQEECRGAGHARNEGMSHATGKYLSFLGADDFFELVMLEELVDAAEARDADIVICDAYIYDDETGNISEPAWIFRESFLPKKPVFSYKDVPDSVFQISAGTAWNRLFRRDLITGHRLKFQVIHSANDLLFTYMSAVKAERITVLNKRLVYYRRNLPRSLSGTIAAWSDGYYESTSELKRSLIAEGYYEAVKRSFANFAMDNCIWYIEEMRSWESFKRFWYNMREKYFQDLDIAGHDKEYFYFSNRYEMYEEIAQKSPEEWMYDRYFALKKGMAKYPFPHEIVQKDSNVILYGAGTIGKTYFTQNIYSRYCRIVLWVDKNWETVGPPVSAISKISETPYDIVLIAALYKDVAEDIKEDLLKLGVLEEDIVWPFSDFNMQ